MHQYLNALESALYAIGYMYLRSDKAMLAYFAVRLAIQCAGLYPPTHRILSINEKECKQI